MSGLLVAGTTSDAGKSIVTTGAVPRLRPPRACKVAPYKAQNMSNNSMVCAARRDARRGDRPGAVGAGARCAGRPGAAMNPVLLKPGSDRRSHVVLMGQPGG